MTTFVRNIVIIFSGYFTVVNWLPGHSLYFCLTAICICASSRCVHMNIYTLQRLWDCLILACAWTANETLNAELNSTEGKFHWPYFEIPIVIKQLQNLCTDGCIIRSPTYELLIAHTSAVNLSLLIFNSCLKEISYLMNFQPSLTEQRKW